MCTLPREEGIYQTVNFAINTLRPTPHLTCIVFLYRSFNVQYHHPLNLYRLYNV